LPERCRTPGRIDRQWDATSPHAPWFQPTATLLKLLPNAEHQRAQALLNQVIDLAQQGGIAYSEFERGRYNSVARIALGLRQRQNIDEVIGEDGAILV
jgi:hypothetical protein